MGKIFDPKDNDAQHVTYIVLTNALFHSDFHDNYQSTTSKIMQILRQVLVPTTNASGHPLLIG